MNKLVSFLKSEAVLSVSAVLAVLSALVVHPDAQYVSYIDFRTLGILLSLMLIMAGLQALQVFRQVGEALACRVKNARSLALLLTALCFFASMFITNDVSLITFVPFTVVTLGAAGETGLLIPVIVLETVAANLGSMATPVGNPQNLYLFSLAGLSLPRFLALLLPYTALSGLLLVAACFLMVRSAPVRPQEQTPVVRTPAEKRRIVLYAALFAVCLLGVVRLIDWRIGLAAVLLAVLLFDRSRFRRADYSLLLTFVFLFVFIGNMKRVPAVSNALAALLTGREVIVSVLLSQVISNVPAAILCSGFTSDFPALLLGVNFGGLGTLIASMASLISFKQYCAVKDARRGRYLAVFTAVNLLFLACLLAAYALTCLF